MSTFRIQTSQSLSCAALSIVIDSGVALMPIKASSLVKNCLSITSGLGISCFFFRKASYSTILTACALFLTYKTAALFLAKKPSSRIASTPTPSVTDPVVSRLDTTPPASGPLVSSPPASVVSSLAAAQVKSASNPHPSIERLKTKYDDFMKQFTFTYEPEGFIKEEQFPPILTKQKRIREDEIETLWENPEILEQANELFKDAANEMVSLYHDLEEKTKHLAPIPRVRILKMAWHLHSQEKGDYFYKRFLCKSTITLLDVYRSLRFNSYILKFPTLIAAEYNQTRYCTPELTPKRADPFFKPGAFQNDWRKRYNEIMEMFRPLMENLPTELVKNPVTGEMEEERIEKRMPKWAAPDLQRIPDQILISGKPYPLEIQPNCKPN
ncbi:MAG TPA: hypothetical protein VMR37_02110 [Rhabdochlamydiaceae bacterium]|nr:hypothetical protein [Rhabdochlamydiaceae bacterium]